MADRDGPDGSQRRSLIALGVVVVLFVLGWLLAHELYASGKLEDCLMSGRTNCVPLETPRPVTAGARAERETCRFVPLSWNLPQPREFHEGVAAAPYATLNMPGD